VKNKKAFLIFLSVIVLLFVSCSTTHSSNQDYRKPSEDLNLILEEISECDNGVYSGISGVYSTKAKMMDKSLMDAAKNVLIHNKTALKNQIYGESSDNSNLYFYDQHIQYSEAELLAVIKHLEVLSIRFSDSLGCVVLTEYKDSTDDFPSLDLEKNKDNTPIWTFGKLDIPGYIIGIGKTDHYSTVRASIEAADYLSVESIFSQVSDIDGFVIHNQMLYNGDYQDESFQGNINSISGVKILSRYYDELNDVYYSLALLKKD
jgi:hypothetical protein